MSAAAPPSDATGARGLGRRAALVVVGATLLVQAWILALPFQLDDYVVLPDPLALLRGLGDLGGDLGGEVGGDVAPFMVRVPMWLAWWLVRLVAPEPLAPLPYHVLGLLLHALTALLLARLVARHAPLGDARRAAGALAGVGFGAAAGGLQAVSWTAAWSSLLYTLFGLGALTLLLDAREVARGARRRRAAAAGLLFLAVVTKEPAVVVPLACGALLAATALATRRPRLLAPELGACAAALAAGALARLAVLGTLVLRHEERAAPGPLEALALLPRGVEALGQALYPWVRDPLMAGEEPLLARVLGPLGLGAPAIAGVVLAPLVALALVLAPRARRPLAALAVAAPFLLVGPAVLWENDPTTNVVSRTTYVALALVCAGLGVALGALARAPRARALGVVAAAVWLALVLDGTVHVARSELANGREIAAARATLLALGEAQARERPDAALLVLAVVPDAGFAGIPSLGPLLPRAVAPPFAPALPLEVRAFPTARALERALPELDLARRDVVLVAPELDERWRPLPPDPGASADASRGRRALEPRTPVRAAPRDAPAARLERTGPASWRLAPPLPAHALSALALERADPARAGELVLARAGAADVRLAVPPVPGEPRPVALGTPLALELALGPPIEAVAWRAHGPEDGAAAAAAELALLPALPAAEPLAPAPGAEIVARPGAPPRFRVLVPDGYARPAFARLELRFTYKGGVESIAADAPVAPGARELELAADGLHLSLDAPALVPTGASWSDFLATSVLPRFDAGLTGATFEWRVTLHHEGGVPAARGPVRTARLVPAAGAP